MTFLGVDALRALKQSYADCDRCELLCESRDQVVFGSGATNARIMVIAEAPGQTENDTGIPLVGDAGRLFMSILSHAWPENDELNQLKNERDDDRYFDGLRDYFDDYIFWTNLVCCWPGEGNRDPSQKEIKACADRLYQTIYAVDPDIIIALGKLAASKLIGKTIAITEKAGQLFDIQVPSPVSGRPVRYAMFALLHPSFLLRKADQDLMKRKKGFTYETVEDLKYLFSLLGMHAKQTGQQFPEEFEE